MSKTTKTLSVDLSLETHNYIAEILKRTGEKRVELFRRIISNEYNRIMNGQSLNETMDEIDPITKKIAENGNSLREGANRIYCSVLFVIKELLRTMHFISGALSNTSLLSKEQLSMLSVNADNEASKSFKSINKILNENQPKDIVEILKKD
jgi:predicted regulator of amino acid metabolism with ACT domain